jgi:phosphoribosylformimino-5-aminoimidazole carboxamide ribotide isomerase
VQIFPAIDIRGGQCVRLRQGDYAQETVFGADPAAIARRWVEQGATYLHLVDLDGARDGRSVNADAVRRIVKTASVPCQLGGGIRTEADICEVLGWGVDRVIIGTRVLQEPEWLERVARLFAGKIVVGIDAKDGYVASEGWRNVSKISAPDLARQCAAWPLAALVYTDITRDGMLEGPNFDAMQAMARQVPLPVIASGGVSSAADVRRLAELGLAGCIIGRALYEGRVDLKEILDG